MTSVPGGIVAETQSTSAEKRTSSQQLGTNWKYFGNPGVYGTSSQRCKNGRLMGQMNDSLQKMLAGHHIAATNAEELQGRGRMHRPPETVGAKSPKTPT